MLHPVLNRFNILYGVTVLWTLQLWLEPSSLNATPTLLAGNIPLLLLTVLVCIIAQRIWSIGSFPAQLCMLFSTFYLSVTNTYFLYHYGLYYWRQACYWNHSSSILFFLFLLYGTCILYVVRIAIGIFKHTFTVQAMGPNRKIGMSFAVLLLFLVALPVHSAVENSFARNHSISQIQGSLEASRRILHNMMTEDATYLVSKSSLLRSFDEISYDLIRYGTYDNSLTIEDLELSPMLSNGLQLNTDTVSESEQHRIATLYSAIETFQTSLREHMTLIPGTHGPNYYTKHLSKEYFYACYQRFLSDINETSGT